MGILIESDAPTPPGDALTPEVVRRVMAAQQAHCAPSTWDKFVRSLAARDFPFDIDAT